MKAMMLPEWAEVKKKKSYSTILTEWADGLKAMTQTEEANVTKAVMLTEWAEVMKAVMITK